MSTTYSIHETSTGNELARITVDDCNEIESLSRDNAEGHFLAGECEDVVSAGVKPDTSVYAILR